MIFNIPLLFQYIRNNKLYLSISFHGPNSKCGVSRYACRLSLAASNYINSKILYAKEPGSENQINCNSHILDSDHLVLSKWTLLSILKVFNKIDKKTIAHFHFPSKKYSLSYLFAPLISLPKIMVANIKIIAINKNKLEKIL